jgi:hypothetical protein
MKFSEYVQSLSPITTVDDKQASLYWNRHFVDGINIWPKLPVHIRTYIRKWERNQRSKDLFKSCKSGRDKLAELNSIKPAAATADVPLNYSSIPIPPPMPQPNSMALHNQQYTIVANSVIGTLTTNAGIKRRRGDRGKDAPDVHRLPRPRRCMNCVKNNGDNFATCAGRTGRGTCQFFPP